MEEILRAYEQGHSALLVTGRSLYDLAVDRDNKLRPLVELLRRESRSRYGMVLVTYSMAGGLDWDESRVDDERDRRTVQSALRAHRLLDIPQDHNELVRVIRGISSLSRTPTEGLRWADERPMRFAFLFEFSEHLTPGTLTNGTQTDPQVIAIELAHITSQSLALRSSGNLVIFHGREGLIDELVTSALYPVRLMQPGDGEKKGFIDTALALYKEARFDNGLTADSVARLTMNTPNRGLEALLRASHRSGKAIAASELVKQKNRDVESLSEHTLTVLDAARVDKVQLCGRNIQTPLTTMERYAQALEEGNSSMPANILLVGPPGTGKTDLAILTARDARVAAYQMHSPKGGIVGETERKARLQQTVLREWQPNVAFCDEISEALPLERTDFDGDSGASRAVMAALLTALSDETRRGRSLLIATTNCPWRMGAAMRSRFTVIPVFHPLKEDFVGIVLATARRIAPDLEIDERDSRTGEAASVFYEKGANPRHILGSLSNALLIHGCLNAESILFAAHDLCASADLVSAIYADLWAIKSCTSRSFLPWVENPTGYPYPQHLEGIVDPMTGSVNHSELERRINELKPHANV
jgi:AAA+ superfamily predicted ATPase